MAAQEEQDIQEAETPEAETEAVLVGFFAWLDRQGWIYPHSPLDDARTPDGLAAEFLAAQGGGAPEVRPHT